VDSSGREKGREEIESMYLVLVLVCVGERERERKKERERYIDR
jgi:hypothetical protein